MWRSDVPGRPSVPFIRSERFRRAYRQLDRRTCDLVQKALAQFLADRTHPGLGVKRIQGTEGIWDMRAGPHIRITFEFQDHGEGIRVLVLRNVGHHDPTLKNP